MAVGIACNTPYTITLVSHNQRQPVKCEWLLGQTVTAVQEHGVLGTIGGTWPFWKGARVQRSWHGLNGRPAKLNIGRKWKYHSKRNFPAEGADNTIPNWGGILSRMSEGRISPTLCDCETLETELLG